MTLLAWMDKRLSRTKRFLTLGRQARSAEGSYLDLGCGSHIRKDFLQIDHRWRPGVDLRWDITRGLPFGSGSIAGIFTEHCVEHIDFEDCLDLLSECYRVLMPQARLRVVVPDGELYVRRYLAGEPIPYHDEDSIRGILTPFMSVNRIFYRHGHRFIYDFETLRQMLSRAGFVDISRREFGQSIDPRLAVDTPARAAESLYVEAVK